MSASVSTPAGATRGPVRAPAPLLRVVPLRSVNAPRVPFVLLVVLLLGGGFVGLLLVNTGLQQGSFVEHDLQRRTAVLAEQRQELAEDLAALEAPESLAARAQAQGMVPMPAPVFLRLSDGRVLGTPTPAPPMAPWDPQRVVLGQTAAGAKAAAAEAAADAARTATARARTAAEAASARTSVTAKKKQTTTKATTKQGAAKQEKKKKKATTTGAHR